MHHGTGQGQALLLPTAERAGQLRLPVLQPVLLQQCVDPLPGLRARQILDGGENSRFSRTDRSSYNEKRWVM
jgi:hypothetical protein